MIIFVPRSHI